MKNKMLIVYYSISNGNTQMPVNPADYDVIAIGTPTWWYTMASAVLMFLKSCSWQGKTVIPFQTHGGWLSHVMKDIKNVCKGATFSHEMEIPLSEQKH